MRQEAGRATRPRGALETVRNSQHCADVKSSVVLADPGILSGTPCFRGTRVPVKNLTDYLEAGDTIDDFLGDFPTVSREQVVRFLEEARESLIAAAT